MRYLNTAQKSPRVRIEPYTGHKPVSKDRTGRNRGSSHLSPPTLQIHSDVQLHFPARAAHQVQEKLKRAPPSQGLRRMSPLLTLPAVLTSPMGRARLWWAAFLPWWQKPQQLQSQIQIQLLLQQVPGGANLKAQSKLEPEGRLWPLRDRRRQGFSAFLSCPPPHTCPQGSAQRRHDSGRLRASLSNPLRLSWSCSQLANTPLPSASSPPLPHFLLPPSL